MTIIWSQSVVPVGVIPAGAPSTFGWSILKIGGGGYVTGMDIHADGTLAARIDVQGGYIGSTTLGTKWRQLHTTSALPSAYWNNNPYTCGGTSEIRIDPSNSNNIWMLGVGPQGRSLTALFKSTDKGNTFSVTGYPITGSDSNDNFHRFGGQTLAIDPNNSSVVYVGDLDAIANLATLRITIDGGTTFSTVSGVPTSTTGICGIVFDSTSGTVSVSGQTRTKRILVGVQGTGHGIYESHDGGVTWALITGSPTSIGHGKLGIDGTAYFTDLIASNVFRITTANVVTNITPPGDPNGAQTIACDPFNADQLVSVDQGGFLCVSSNCRAATPTWSTSVQNHTISAADGIGWMQSSQDNFISCGEAWLDPSVANRLWFSNGISVMYADNVYAISNAGTLLTWKTQTSGIENLVVNNVIASPTSPTSLLVAMWDRPYWSIPEANTVYPSNYGPYYEAFPANSPVMFGADISYGSANSNHAVGLMGLSNAAIPRPNDYGFSTDNGVTWSIWPSTPSFVGLGGCICNIDANNVLIIEAQAIGLHLTQNGGTTWSSPTGLPTDNSYNTQGFSTDSHPLCADLVDTSPGTYYCYCNGATPGLYKSVNAGTSFAIQFSGHIDSFDAAWMVLRAVPGNSGHLFYSSGVTNFGNINFTSVATVAASVPIGQLFWRSQDHGTTFTSVPNVQDVICFGFGKAKPGGGGYPTVFVNGWVNQGAGYKYGLYRSDDAQNATPTWTKIGAFPRGWVDTPKTMCGDLNNYNVCYVGYTGSSVAIYNGPADGHATPTP